MDPKSGVMTYQFKWYLDAQMHSSPKFIIILTNGLDWQFFENGSSVPVIDIHLDTNKREKTPEEYSLKDRVSIDPKEFAKLICTLRRKLR